MNTGNRISKMLKLALLFALIGRSASAEPQKKEADINAPFVRISGVTNRGIVGDDATLVIRVEWTSQTAQGVTLLGFTARSQAGVNS